MIAVLTGMGLSAAAGLNAYIPFLVVALIAKYTDFIVLPAAYGWMESWWAIGIGAALLLTEVVVDKVPAVDTVNDAVQTFIRPSMGGLLAAATAGAAELDNSAWMAQNPWVGVLLGVVVAGLVHAGKTTARPAANVATLGVGAPVLSTVEDGASLSLSLIALFVPVLVVVALLAVLAALGWLVWRRRRRAGAGWPAPRSDWNPAGSASAAADGTGSSCRRAAMSATVDAELPSHADRAVARILEPSHPAQHVRRFQYVCASPQCARRVRARGDSSERARGLTVRACSGRCCSPPAGRRGSGPSRRRPRRCGRWSTGSSPEPISTPRCP